MFWEHRGQRPPTMSQFARRLLGQAGRSMVIVLVSLVIGMAGYSTFEHLAWRDSFLNAAMLLGGMGPVNAPITSAGKIFAGLYALYAGLIFLLVAGMLFAPVVHCIVHRIHWESDEPGGDASEGR
jgi:hypothetical protein